MSGRIVQDVLEYAPKDLTNAELLVLIAIAEDARDTDRLARYSDLKSIIRKSRQAPGTVRNALSTLTSRALLAPIHDVVHRGGVHQEYRVAVLKDHHRNGTVVSLHDDTNPRRRVTGQ